MTEQTG